MENNEKKRILSMYQCTGTFTLGNYLGALRNHLKFQEEGYTCVYALADLHALTVRHNPADLRKYTKEAYAFLLAMGIDLNKTLFFIQSQVPQHTQLAWVLNCYALFGELSRMTQFKDKSQKHEDNINAGLFTYPCLMAADILLYQADYVPVGADQKQHVEIARDIAERFNGVYGDTFTVPEPLIPQHGARVMSLQNPKSKMSKSDENQNGNISVLDDPDTIMRKFKRAVTDSESQVRFAPGKDGVNNLMGIYAAVTGKTMEEIEREFEGKGYGEFKPAVAEAVIAELRPIQERFREIVADKAYLEQCYRENAPRAQAIAQKTVSKVYRKVGLVS